MKNCFQNALSNATCTATARRRKNKKTKKKKKRACSSDVVGHVELC
jgi:hypothetical protein